MTSGRYRQIFRVPSGPSGARDGIAAQALTGFLQEAAGRDAEERGAGMSLLREQGLAWVLVRLGIGLEPGLGAEEDVTVTTWPTRFGRATAERDFAVADARGERVALASSRWAVFDLRTRRAVRVPDFIRALEVPQAPPVLPLPPWPDADPATRPLGECRIEVTASDLDLLGHANNTRYLKWALAALPAGFTEIRVLRHLDQAFKREVLEGERFLSRALLVAEDTVLHELRKEDEAEACASILTRWTGQGSAKAPAPG